MGTYETRAQDHVSLIAAIGEPGTKSFAFGTALWALSHTDRGVDRWVTIETAVVSKSSSRARLLYSGRLDLILVEDHVPTPLARRVRAIMALWPSGVAVGGTEPMQLLVHADISDDVVYRITAMIFENSEFFDDVHRSIRMSSPEDAMIGLDVTIHPGAHKYLQQMIMGSDRTGFDAAVKPEETASLPRPRLETILPPDLFDDPDVVQQFSAACRAIVSQGALDHFRGHGLASDCRNLGMAAVGRRHGPSM